MLRVGSTTTDFCKSGAADLGSAPIKRYVLPSTRIKLTSEWSRRVQCFVVEPLSWSLSDQMLKNGLWVTSGTAGGRKSLPNTAAERRRAMAAERPAARGMCESDVMGGDPRCEGPGCAARAAYCLAAGGFK